MKLLVRTSDGSSSSLPTRLEVKHQHARRVQLLQPLCDLHACLQCL